MVVRAADSMTRLLLDSGPLISPYTREHYQRRLCDRVTDSAALRLKLMSLYYYPFRRGLIDLLHSWSLSTTVHSSPVCSDPAPHPPSSTYDLEPKLLDREPLYFGLDLG